MRGEKFSGHERANALKQGGRRRKWSRRHRASPGGKRPAMRSDLDRTVERIACWTAMAGGGALVVAMVLTVGSIVGRGPLSAGLGPFSRSVDRRGGNADDSATTSVCGA